MGAFEAEPHKDSTNLSGSKEQIIKR